MLAKNESGKFLKSLVGRTHKKRNPRCSVNTTDGGGVIRGA